jgi:hypothetical protein
VQKNIFIAAATRSGSTHIRNCFIRLGLKAAPLNAAEPGHYNEEHMLDRYAADLLIPLGGFTFYYHTRAIGRNIPILKDHGVTPIVTYRNVLEFIFLPMHGPSDWMSLGEDEKWTWIATNVVPWLFSFYISWHESGLHCLYVGYKKHYADEMAGMKRIIRWLRWEKVPTDEQIAKVIANQDGRFNLGETGRGRKVLPPKVIELVYTLAGAWGSYWGPRLTNELIEEE